MGAVLNFSAQLQTETCCVCAIEFAAPVEFVAARRRDKKLFFCPSGHEQQYMGETHEAKLVRLMAERDAARSQRDEEAARVERARKEASRLRKRPAAGVCPCCHRTFNALKQHMKAKHPAYGGAPKGAP